MSHALCVISPYADIFDHSYLRFVVSAESSLAQAQHGVQSIGVPDLGVGSIRSLLIPVPPKNKQGTIVSKINELIALCDQLKERLNQASETRCHLAEAVVEGALN
jgi:type I restriction enzyme S subunit